MTTLLSEAGRSFLRAFLATFIPLVTGVLAAPNLGAGRALSIAALVSSIAAGIKAVQTFLPSLTVGAYVEAPIGAIVDSFLRAFIGTFLVATTGWLQTPNYDTARSAGVAAFTGALAAGIRAIQGYLQKGDLPAANVGLAPPGTPEVVAPNP